MRSRRFDRNASSPRDRTAPIARSKESLLRLSQLWSSFKPSTLTVTVLMPVRRHSFTVSFVIAKPFVTMPQGKPRVEILSVTAKRSFLSKGSPPVTATMISRGSYRVAMDSNPSMISFAVNSDAVSLVEEQSLPQWRQLRLHESVASRIGSGAYAPSPRAG